MNASAAAPPQPEYRFALGETEKWRGFLKTHGYAVIAGALQPAEVATARSQLWTDIDRLWPRLRAGARRAAAAADGDADAEADGDVGPDWSKVRASRPGFVPQLCQSAGAWTVRGAPGVRRAFAAVWGCDEADLITSMDCVILWQPWGCDPQQQRGRGTSTARRRPQTEGMHLDQNPFTHPGLECVQGMVPLRPVTAATGGLAVVPDSHAPPAQAALRERNQHLSYAGAWCPLTRDPVVTRPDARVLLLAQPGDLILWDSRTVHGGVVGEGCRRPRPTTTQQQELQHASSRAVVDECGSKSAEAGAGGGDGGSGGDGADSASAAAANAPQAEQKRQVEETEAEAAERWRLWTGDFARMSVTVSMTERSRASAETLRARRAGYEAGISFNHTPHEAGDSNGTIHSGPWRGYVPCPLTQAQSMLLDGTVDGVAPSPSSSSSSSSAAAMAVAASAAAEDVPAAVAAAPQLGGGGGSTGGTGGAGGTAGF